MGYSSIPSIPTVFWSGYHVKTVPNLLEIGFVVWKDIKLIKTSFCTVNIIFPFFLSLFEHMISRKFVALPFFCSVSKCSELYIGNFVSGIGFAMACRRRYWLSNTSSARVPALELTSKNRNFFSK